MDAMPRVSIIILNWNGWKDTIECLESVYQITYPNYDVIVVDNGSENESIEKIKQYARGDLEVTSKFFSYSKENKPLHYIEYTLEETKAGERKEAEIADIPSQRKIILIKNGKNYGFAEGNNIAIRYAINNLNPQYIFLLNNDTVIEKMCLEQMIEVADRDESIGILGPVNYYYNYLGQSDIIHFAGGHINWISGTPTHRGKNKRDIGQFSGVAEVDYVTGAALCANVQMIKAIGLLNAQFFAYWEETDWCMRAQRANYKCVFVPTSKMWHKVSSSSKTITGFPVYQMTRNMFWFMQLNTSKSRYIFFVIYYLTVKIWYKLVGYLIIRRDPKIIGAYIHGIRDGLKPIETFKEAHKR